MNDQPSNQSRQLSIPLNAPLAIVIAGALIAAALYFKPGTGGVGNSNKTAGSGVTPPPAAGEPVEPPVGTFREVDPARDHIRGAANAKVTVIEYSDYECPFCKRFHTTLQQLLQEYPNDVRWVYRHFPLEQLHSKAKAEANASECAAEQGKFWEFSDIVFRETPSNDGLDLAKLPEYAREAGVANIAQFQSCVSSNKYASKVEEDLADAESAGGQGTPYSVVIGPDGTKKPISGAQPYATVKATIDSLL